MPWQNTPSSLLFALTWLLWAAWCLWCVDWQKTWPVLAQGAWAPVVLVMLLAALVWSQIDAHPYYLSDSVGIANYWWQLLCIGAIVAVALFCGWLQGVIAWKPLEVAVEPTPEDDASQAHH